MKMKIEGDYVVYECGCKFKILDKGPPLRIEWDIDYDSLNYDCEATWDFIGQGNTKGIFQLETRFGQQMAKKLKPKNMEHLSALAAILRPGALESRLDGKSLTEHYIDRKNGLDEVKYFHPSLEPVLNDTYGILIYQEESMAIASQLAGFTLKEADNLRKCAHADTMFVSKTRGWISIKDLMEQGYENDLFLIMGEDGQQQWKKIEKIWCTGEQAVEKVETRTGFYTYLTQYHQVLTNNGWVARRRLNTDDFIVCANEIHYDGQDLISRDMAFVIAGMITEGYFVDKQCSHFTNWDQDVMRWFSDAYNKEFGMMPKMHNENKVAGLHHEVKLKIAKHMKYGKSGVKEIPKVMMGMTLESTRDFLSLMLEAEGGCTNQGAFGISSKSEKLIDQQKLLLLRFGVRGTKYKKFNKKYQCYYYCLDITDGEEQKKLYKELTGYWSKRKKEELKTITESKNTNNYSINIIPINIKDKLIRQYPFVFNPASGSVFTKPMTRYKFKRFCDATNDTYWMNFANNSIFYDQYIEPEHRIASTKVYDFTVEGGDTPYIIANGMVIHNSLGKKKADEMSKIKNQFIDGCIKVGKVNATEAEEIFGWIEKGQRYIFNKCLSIDTMVQTRNGNKTIQNVAIGEEILAPSDDGDKYVKIVNKYDNGNKLVFKVTLDNGNEIICTGDHKFLCSDKQTISLKEILLSFPIKEIVCHNDLPQSISSFDLIGVKQTADLEVDSEDHIFYANGIATSNSHSYSYAVNGYMSAYTKAHMTKSFFTSYLYYAKEKPKKFNEIKLLVNDAKSMKIEMRPPSLSCLHEHFKRIDGKIVFGLMDIKEFGESAYKQAIATIEEETGKLGKPIHQFTWAEFLILVAQNIKTPAVRGMIECGVLDSLKVDRLRMLFEFEQCCILSPKELKFIRDNIKGTFAETLEFALSHEKFCMKNRRGKLENILGSLKKPPYSLVDTPDWIARVEEARMGVSLTCSVVDGCKDADQANTCCMDVKSGKCRHSGIFLAAQLKEVKSTTTKNGKNPGQEMAFVTFSDHSGELDAVIFPDAWKDIFSSNVCFDGNLVLISGEVDKKKGSFIVKNMWQLS